MYLSKRQKYLKIREDKFGRIIEAMVIDPILYTEEEKKEKTEHPLYTLFIMFTFIGWGFCGVMLGNFLFLSNKF